MLFLLAIMVTVSARTQVFVDGPVHLTGSDSERKAEGLAAPHTVTSALTVEASLLGTVHWANASISGNLVTLAPIVPAEAPRTGDLLRFLAPAELFDSVRVRFPGQAQYALFRPDGIPPVRGQVKAGVVCEILFAEDHWVLLNAPLRGCPPGTIAVSDRLCVEVTGVDNTVFSVSNDRCMGMGGRLCSWGEFYVACSQFATQLTGIGTGWEWLDDTSNHAHSVSQAGNQACTAQRWANPETLNNFRARGRCCVEPR